MMLPCEPIVLVVKKKKPCVLTKRLRHAWGRYIICQPNANVSVRITKNENPKHK